MVEVSYFDGECECKHFEIKGDIKKAIQDLESETEGCPACTLAAIRQSGILVPLTEYNFTKALEQFWANINETERTYEHECTYL